MKCTGIVVEYNPFHNGHLYHIKETRRLINPDAIIAVMSPNWVQRGEPAIINKWARAEMALKQGVDLVLELPFIWATQSAKEFAQGSIAILNATGLVKYQTFGSESADSDFLTQAAEILEKEPGNFKIELKKYLKEGYSYPKASANALNNLTNIDKELTPNDILGVEYIKSHLNLSTGITPMVIRRTGSNYHDKELTSNLASATAIRNALKENKIINNYVPESTVEILAKHDKNFVFFKDLEKYLIYRLRTSSQKELSKYIGWEKGLEDRFKKSAIYNSDIESVLNQTITKRYTRGRLNRYLIHLLVDLKRDKVNYFNKKGPAYLRVLGMNKRGQEALKKMKDTATLPVLTRPAKELRKLSPYVEACFREEVRATSVYNLLINKEGNEDFTKNAVITPFP